VNPHAFLQNLALVLCVAAVTTVVCQRLRQPVVLGYLLAGLLVGPHVAFPLFAETRTIETLSELGVILLMFSIGLEFNMRKLVALIPTAGLVAVIQIGVMVVTGFLGTRAMGWAVRDSLVAGAMISVSSTMIIAQAFKEAKPDRTLTDLVFGVLIMEDLAAVLMLAALATLMQPGGATLAGLLPTAGRLALFLLVTIGVGLVIVPRAVRGIVALKRPETTLVASVGICFAFALLANKAGYSVALGAFLGGALVGESGVESRVAHLVEPVRDMFAAIFFVSVGMLLDPGALQRNWEAVLVLTVLVITGNLFGVSVGSFLAGYNIRTSVRAGMSMAQIGEFSFIIAGAYLAAGGNSRLYSVAVGVAVITSFLTPLLIRWADPLALLVDRKLPRPLQTVASLYGSWVESLRQRRSGSPWAPLRGALWLLLAEAAFLAAIAITISLEFTRLREWLGLRFSLGPDAARAALLLGAAALGVPFTVGLAREGRRIGEILAARAIPLAAKGKVDQGRAPRRVLSRAAQIGVLLVIGLLLLAVTQPFVPAYAGPVVVAMVLLIFGIGFWRAAKDLQGHLRASAEVAAHMLTAEHRRADTPEQALEQVEKLLPGIGSLSAVKVTAGGPADRRTLAELNLRGLTGATVVAVSRGERSLISPSGNVRLEAGDVLALSGTTEAVAAAEAQLTGSLR
jgi:CPA2 family monovalent cation:H+ antiporter-2